MTAQPDYLADAREMAGKGYAPEENIFRVQKTERYFVASNIPFNDERLTWEARGVMGYLLSKPENWQIRMNDLVHKGPAKMTVIRRILAELRKYGYMNRTRKLGGHGHFYWVTTLYESPELNAEYRRSTIYTNTIDGQTIDGKHADVLSTDLRFNDNKENASIETPTAQPTSTYEPDEKEISSNLVLLCKLTEKHLPGMITAGMRDLLIDCAKTYPARFYEPAFVAGTAQNARKWSFVSACIKNAAEGVEYVPPAKKSYTPKPVQKRREMELVF